MEHISSRDNLSSYLFFVVISGSGILYYNSTMYTLTTGACVFIDCNKGYSHETFKDDLWDLKWIHFNGLNMSEIYNKYIERGGTPTFYPEDLRDYYALWNSLFELSTSSDYIKDMRINEYLNSLLTLIMQESWNPNSVYTTEKNQTLINVKKYLDEHFTDKITLDELSDRFFINKFYLTRIYKQKFGTSINNYISQKRITYAKQLLRFTDNTVENIGIECGISDVHYFSKVFKKIEGVAPSEYRAMW
jgi:AraC-like DNA-binding protein